MAALSTIDSFYGSCLPAQLISSQLGKVYSKELGKREKKMKHDMFMKAFNET